MGVRHGLSGEPMTLFGPFLGVSLSLMAVRYTDAGIASTLMAGVALFFLL